MQVKQTDILISGGGIAGLTLAALLGGAGLDVVLVEPRPPQARAQTKASGRTVALMESSLNVIKATGIWSTVESLSNPLKTMRIIDDSMSGSDTIESEFPASDLGMEQFGFNITNAYLRAALYEQVQTIKSVTIFTPHNVSDFSVTSSHVLARLEDGTEIKTSLIIGADGRSSAVRKISGIEIKESPYGQKAITCLINHSRAHNDTSTEFHRPSGPLAFVPLPGNQSAVVWVEPEKRADDIMRLKKNEFEQSLQSLSHDILGGITLECNPESWPLCSIKAKSLIAPRTALIAEAAHVMSPITAQGLNLSLRDVAALAETIIDALRLGLDIGSDPVLKKYESRRSLDVNTRVFGVDSMNRIVSTDQKLLKGVRRMGLKTVDAIEPLKKFAMRQGLAPQNDLGRLAKGGKL